MLVLTSNSLSNDELFNKVKRRVLEKNFRNAVLVVTADNMYKEKNWNVARLKAELESMGLIVRLFDFDSDNVEILKDADVIEFNGGNPFYLLDRLNKAEIKGFLNEFVKSKIIIGMSAGSLVLQKTINLVNEFSSDMNFVGLKTLEAMDLVDIEILPHYNSLNRKFENVEEICQTYSDKHSVEIIKLNDGEGITVDESGTLTIFRNSKDIE